ncbi:MAG: hypothetical protein ACREOC_15300 [Gemmatimonadales bacterium]
MTHKQQADELLERPPTTLRPALTRLAAYYGAVAVLFAVATWVLSGLPAPGLEQDIQPLESQGALASAADLWSRLGRLAPGWLHAGLYMLASVLLVFPLVFVYLRTRTRAKFDHSLLQTVIVLPLAVTAVLMMVRSRATRCTYSLPSPSALRRASGSSASP